MESVGFTFSAIRGVQAGMEYYVCMVPLCLLPKLFVFNDEKLSPEARAQRMLNKARIPEMRDYILDNLNSYVFSALTASVDAEIKFEKVNENMGSGCDLGIVKIPLTAQFLINDGQHRKAAIEAAIKKKPVLQYEHIAIVLYEDMGLKRSQQIFSDLNKHAIRPTKSLNILYDNRDSFSIMLCELIEELPFFRNWVEKEHGTISNRSKALFTLSGLFRGSKALTDGIEVADYKQIVKEFWEKAYESMPDWQDVVQGRMKSSRLREESICGHTIALLALGNVGHELLKKGKDFSRLERLRAINWEKTAPEWQGNVVLASKISGTRASVKYLSDELINTVRGE